MSFSVALRTTSSPRPRMFNPILRCAESYPVRHALAPAFVTRGVRSAEILFVLAAYGKNPPAAASFSVALLPTSLTRSRMLCLGCSMRLCFWVKVSASLNFG